MVTVPVPAVAPLVVVPLTVSELAVAVTPVLEALMARAITAELVEGNGRVYSITDAGRAELDAYLSHLDVLKDNVDATVD